MKTSLRRSAFTLVEIMIVVVIIGLLAAMALPQFQRIRATAQDKAVVGNLRQISSGANLYFTESGRTSVDLNELMGTASSQYVKPFLPVAFETYTPTLILGSAVTASGVAGSRTITFGL
jgi:type IV pilus assembly protein PilA